MLAKYCQGNSEAKRAENVLLNNTGSYLSAIDT